MRSRRPRTLFCLCSDGHRRRRQRISSGPAEVGERAVIVRPHASGKAARDAFGPPENAYHGVDNGHAAITSGHLRKKMKAKVRAMRHAADICSASAPPRDPEPSTRREPRPSQGQGEQQPDSLSAGCGAWEGDSTLGTGAQMWTAFLALAKVHSTSTPRSIKACARPLPVQPPQEQEGHHQQEPPGRYDGRGGLPGSVHGEGEYGQADVRKERDEENFNRTSGLKRKELGCSR